MLTHTEADENPVFVYFSYFPKSDLGDKRRTLNQFTDISSFPLISSSILKRKFSTLKMTNYHPKITLGESRIRSSRSKMVCDEPTMKRPKNSFVVARILIGAIIKEENFNFAEKSVMISSVCFIKFNLLFY